MKFKPQLKPIAFALTALAASGANAAIITQWQVGVDAKFLPNTIYDSEGNQPGGVTISNSDRRLRWGSGDNGQSGLDITNAPINTVVDTGISPTVNPAVPNVSITHRNRPISGDSLGSVSLSVSLTLTPLAPPLGALPVKETTFLIDFLETTNHPGSGSCAGGGSDGSGVNSNGCADIFVIGNDALNYSFKYDTDGVGGDPEQEYFISFVEATSGLNALSTKACKAATGSEAACLGFLTPEAADTTFQFGALITTQRVVIIPDDPTDPTDPTQPTDPTDPTDPTQPTDPRDVPEPDMLLLMGAGLAGLGIARRRRRKA